MDRLSEDSILTLIPDLVMPDRIRTLIINTNPNDAEDNAAGRSVRAYLMAEGHLESECFQFLNAKGHSVTLFSCFMSLECLFAFVDY